MGALFLLIWMLGFASCVVLIFFLHDVLWDGGSDWWIGLQKDDELLLKGGGFASVVFNF